VALAEDPLAGPAADDRRLRAVGRLIAAPRTNQSHDGVRGGGARKSLLAFLGAGAQRVRVEPFLGFDAYGSVVLTHEGLLHVAAGVLRRRSPGACAMRRDWASDQRLMSNPASSISIRRSRAKRGSTQRAPGTRGQG